MTLPPSDSPDWTGVPGGARFLGSIDMTGTAASKNVTLNFAPASYDGAVYVISTGNPFSPSGIANVKVVNNDNTATLVDADMYAQGAWLAEPLAAFVSAAMGASWAVNASVDQPTASTWKLWVFAVPSYPGARIVRDQSPLLVVQTGAWARVAYSSQLRSTPAAGAIATVTFAATADRRWVLDHASFRLMGRGTADIQTAQLTDGGVAFYQQRMSVTATSGVLDEHIIGPNAGYSAAIGAALGVTFAAAPAAANFEVISAGAYQLLA